MAVKRKSESVTFADLGVSDNNVTLLSEADAAALEQVVTEDVPAPRTGPVRGTQGSGSAWKALLDHMRDRTVRRVA